MLTVPKPQTHQHKPHPDLAHTTQIKCRMQHFALFPFSNVGSPWDYTLQGEELIQQWHNAPKQDKRLSTTADPPGAQARNTGPFPPTLAVPQHGAWPLRKENKVLMENHNPMLPSSTSSALHLVEDLSQQPTNPKGLAGKTWVLFIDLEYARQHHENKTKKEIISNLCCQEKQGSQRFSPKLLFKKSFRAKQPPRVHLPCIAQSGALVRHKSLPQSDGLGSGTSKLT